MPLWRLNAGLNCSNCSNCSKAIEHLAVLKSVKIEHANASLYTVLILTEMQPDTKAHPSIIDLKSKTKKDQPLTVWFLKKKSHLGEFASHGESSRGSSSLKYMGRKLWFNKETVILILSGKSSAL